MRAQKEVMNVLETEGRGILSRMLSKIVFYSYVERTFKE